MENAAISPPPPVKLPAAAALAALSCAQFVYSFPSEPPPTELQTVLRRVYYASALGGFALSVGVLFLLETFPAPDENSSDQPPPVAQAAGGGLREPRFGNWLIGVGIKRVGEWIIGTAASCVAVSGAIFIWARMDKAEADQIVAYAVVIVLSIFIIVTGACCILDCLHHAAAAPSPSPSEISIAGRTINLELGDVIQGQSSPA